MYKYILQRLVLMVPTLFGVTVAVFLSLRLIPGTIVDQMLGTEATASEETKAAMAHYFGLDEPIWQQYLEWSGKLLHGNLGDSWRTAKPVMELIMERLPVTLELTALAMLLAVAIGVPLGIVSAMRQDGATDNLARVTSLLGLSIPTFWWATMLILVFSLTFRWAPPVNWVPLVQLDGSGVHFDTLLTNLKMMVLPAAALGWASAAAIQRMTRSSMLDVLRQDYMRAARSKGLRERILVYRHGLKNALIPVVTVFGLQVATLLGGAVVTEEVFTLPGVGRLVLWSIYQRDYPLVQGTVLFVAVLFITINLVIDIIYSLLDPRIRYAEA